MRQPPVYVARLCAFGYAVGIGCDMKRESGNGAFLAACLENSEPSRCAPCAQQLGSKVFTASRRCVGVQR